jgi:RimJ/RimL family protein N-acetyltransferase
MTAVDTHRGELAALVGRADHLRLAEVLDSLGMMKVLVWLESRGVTIADDRAGPTTVGDVLALVSSGLSISIGPERELAGPTTLPALPRSVSPLSPVLTAGAFELTPVQPGDTDFLYWLSCHPETCFRWRYRGAPPAYDRFVADLWSRVLVQFVVRRSEDGEPVGHVVGYAADSTMRHAYVGAVFAPAHTGTGLPAQAVRTFVDFLFHTFPLHKLYLEVPGYNWPQLESGAGHLFDVEGVLFGHDYYAGQYWDKRVCAIYRSADPVGGAAVR